MARSKTGITPISQEEFEVAEKGSYLDALDEALRGNIEWHVVEIPSLPPFRIRALAWADEQQAHIDAAKYIQDRGLDPSRHEALTSNEATVRILYRACVTMDSHPANASHPERALPLAETLDKFRSHPAINDLLLHQIYAEYLEAKLAFAPSLEQMSAEAIAEVIAALKKNPSSTVLRRWPRIWLEALIDTLVSQDAN